MKDTSRSKLALATLLVATAIASTASADECRLFKDANRAGTDWGMTLMSDVTHTFAIGSPNDSTWANSSTRYLQSTLSSGGINNNASSAQIVATQSDVSFYMFDGDNFTGRTTVFFCPKGYTCWFDTLGSHIDNRTSSAICQREFFRKAGKKPGDDIVKQLQRAQNPFIPFADISQQVTTAVHAAASASNKLDAVRHTTGASEDGVTLFSRTLWLPKPAYCAKFAKTCESRDRYVDYMHISKKFEVDLGSAWFDIGFFVDDDYAFQVDWYLRPVLDGSGNTLKFWWAKTTYWVEDGSFDDEVMSSLSAEIAKVNIQTALRDGVVGAAVASGCHKPDLGLTCEVGKSCWCLDGKERLQMSFFVDDTDIRELRFLRNFNIDTDHPTMVLNTSRNAQ